MLNMPQELPDRLKTNVKVLLPVAIALKRVTSTSGNGVYASSDKLFRGAIFGRDSIEVAEHILGIRPKLVRDIILTLAKLQGERRDDITEEEPGRIVHEYRTTTVDGKKIGIIQQALFDELAAKWGGTKDVLAYYGAVDSTPHYIRLVHMYVKQYGRSILDEEVVRRSGRVNTIAESCNEAFEWVKARLQKSHSGFVEYNRVNPQGLPNQVWKDSEEFYVHTDGHMANHTLPIASIEVQGLTYDACLAVFEMLGRAEAKELAESVRNAVLTHLWMPEVQYFALGTDYAPTAPDKPRVIKTITANPAYLLNTRIFDELAEEQKQMYMTGILRRICSYEFLTDAGIRSRALSGAHLVSHWDYHGSFVAWPKETYDIAIGMVRHGFTKLGAQLENRILNVVWKNREYPEFVYVDGYGRVLSTSPAGQKLSKVIMVNGPNDPERLQAWTVSSVMAILSERLSPRALLPKSKKKSESWQAELEKELLHAIPRVGNLINPIQLALKYPTYKYKRTR